MRATLHSRPTLRTASVIAVALMLSSCAYGARQTRADSTVPDLTIPPGQMEQAASLPQPQDADDVALLANHVAVAKAYHALADRLAALVCTITGSKGITINGTTPSQPASCDVFDPRDDP